jgi:hypothetical protein
VRSVLETSTTGLLGGDSTDCLGSEEYFEIFIYWTAEISSSDEYFPSKVAPDTSQNSESIFISADIDGHHGGDQDRSAYTTSDPHLTLSHTQTDPPTSLPTLHIPPESSTSYVQEAKPDTVPRTKGIKFHRMEDISSEDEIESIECEDSDPEQETHHESFEARPHTPSMVPESPADTHIQYGESGDDSQSSDDEVDSVYSGDSDGDRIWSLLWPKKKTAKAQVHSPISTESWSIEYTSNTKNLIETTLTKLGVIYFFALTVLRIGSIEAPVIVILTDSAENIGLVQRSLEKIVQDNSTYVWLFGKGTITPSANNSSDTKYPRYHKNIQAGDAIVARKDEAGTVGLLVRKPNSRRIHGLTAGHVFEDLPPGRPVIHPAVKHLRMDITDIRYRIQRLKTQLREVIEQSIRSKLEDDLRKFQNDLNNLYELKGANDNETRKNLKIGKIIASEFCPVLYKERNCLSDWGMFEVTRDRRPETIQFNSRPVTGVLDNTEWKSVKQFGPLKVDQRVRKYGQVTDLTFGFVAGVHAGWNPGIANCPPLTEFYVLEEKASRHNRFAQKGDSGSAVITAEGDLVGIVFAFIDVEEIAVVVDVESKVPDIMTIAHRRKSDGTVDDHQLWTDWYESESFILVQCAEMMRERAGIEGEIFPYN